MRVVPSKIPSARRPASSDRVKSKGIAQDPNTVTYIRPNKNNQLFVQSPAIPMLNKQNDHSKRPITPTKALAEDEILLGKFEVAKKKESSDLLGLSEKEKWFNILYPTVREYESESFELSLVGAIFCRFVEHLLCKTNYTFQPICTNKVHVELWKLFFSERSYSNAITSCLGSIEKQGEDTEKALQRCKNKNNKAIEVTNFLGRIRTDLLRISIETLKAKGCKIDYKAQERPERVNQILEACSQALKCSITVYERACEKYYLKSKIKGLYSFNIHILIEKKSVYGLYKKHRNLSAVKEMRELVGDSLTLPRELKANGNSLKLQLPYQLLMKNKELEDECKNTTKELSKVKKKLASTEESFVKQFEKAEKAHKEEIAKYKKTLETPTGVVEEEKSPNARRGEVTQIPKKHALEHKKEPEKVLVVGKKPTYCPSCGNLRRILIERFTECASDCAFHQRCAYCLYSDKFGSLEDRGLAGCCDKCFAVIDPKKLEEELRQMVDARFLNAFKNK